ncbi:IPP transferase-domain-containing protein [Obelidium mucronatum]|nr:IPP transferase-domain-containing protein [Obelidium mucronatum]
MSSLPVVAVLGTTGVGKSNLAIELALALNGEVINADSMQVYKGLDVITNKVTKEEQALVKHHLLDFVDPIDQDDYSVLKFEKDALRVIADIHSRGKLPILVGGTHYYVQSVLWDSHLVSSEDDVQQVDSTSEDIFSALQNSDSSFKYKPDSEQDAVVLELGRLLAEVDPAMAIRWHPKDWRKIRRSLQVFYTRGERHSDILNRQKEDGGGSLRFRTCVFWLWAENKALDMRLDSRVDTMISNGLFTEIQDMRKRVREANNGVIDIDYTRGIMQTIGFKEFDGYLTYLEKPNDSEDVASLKKQSVESMQAATRRYARRQISWIKNKLGPKCVDESKKPNMQSNVAFWALDATDLSSWKVNVQEQGISLCKQFLSGKVDYVPSSLTATLLNLDKQTALDKKQTDWAPRKCEICTAAGTGEIKLIHGAREWDIHLKSKTHVKMVKRLKWKADFTLWKDKKEAADT